MATTGLDSGHGPVDGFCAVTVVCGKRRLDVALPSTVAWADLEPSVLRLLFADEPPARVGRWVVTPVGRAELALTETLASAGVLAADVLHVRQSTGERAAPGVVHDVRDRVEDLVDGRDQFWGRKESRMLVLWTAVGVGALLLVVAAVSVGVFAVADLPIADAGPWPSKALLAVTVAVVLALAAIFAARSKETSCAAVALLVGCGWAAVAGGAGLRGWTVPVGAPPTTAVAAGAASALLIAVCCVAFYPGAVVHTAALGTAGAIASVVAVAVRAGAPAAESACLAALASVMAIGATPRVALAVGGVGGGGTALRPARLDARISRAEAVLTGLVAGVSLVAVLGAAPAATSSDGWHRLFALGLGLSMMLRSRAFSQVRHALAVRVGAIVVVAELWAGLAVGVPAVLTLLILGAVVALAVALTMLAGPPWAPVGQARVGRMLDLLELGLMVAMVVLAAGLLGCFGWLPALIR